MRMWYTMAINVHAGPHPIAVSLAGQIFLLREEVFLGTQSTAAMHSAIHCVGGSATLKSSQLNVEAHAASEHCWHASRMHCATSPC